MTVIQPETDSSESSLNDRSLLRRFLQDDDDKAFAQIIVRHQRLVMSACRRIVGQSADAEDAFQATFLTLARRPRSLRRCRSLAGWLYTVATRTSRRLVRQRIDKRMSALSVAESASEPDPIDLIAQASDIAAVDEELNRLPAKYRDVLVMTYFADQTSQQIADELHESKGAIDGRIRQARNALRVRLARRGVELAAITAVAALQSSTAAAASPTLLKSTIALGHAVLTNPAESLVDSSHLTSLIKPEFALMNTRMLLTTGLAGALLVALAGAASQFTRAAGAVQGTTVNAAAEDPGSDHKESPISIAVATPFVGSQSSAASSDSPFGNRVANRRPGMLPGFATSAKRAAAARIREVLIEPGPALEFPGELPLSEVLSAIAEFVKETHGLNLQIVPDHAELQMDGVPSLDDVFVVDVTFSDAITLHSALELIFRQTSEPSLDYLIKDEVMLVTTATAAELPENMETRVYEVSGLLSLFPAGGVASQTGPVPVASGPGMGPGDGSVNNRRPRQFAQTPLSPTERLIDEIQSMTASSLRWLVVDGDGGHISATQNLLIVRQSRQGHELIADFLEQLSEAAASVE
jgi:RNA polymerase sigma factor (sigma-70 family)